MKVHGSIQIGNRHYKKGDEIPWYQIYPFFLIHMFMFGASGFLMAYSSDKTPLHFMYLHGGIAIFAYVIFYIAIFGIDQVKWMFINAGLGLLGTYTQIGWILDLFGKDVDAYPIEVHVTPFLYFMLYTFLLRQMVIDIFGAREDEMKRNRVENIYVIVSVFLYLSSYLSFQIVI